MKWILLLALALSGPKATQDGDRPEYALPTGRVAEAWQRVGAETRAIELVGWPAWKEIPGAADPWDRDEPWRRWVELVRRGRDGQSSVRDLGELALLALAQGRHLDAWGHVAGCADNPEVLTALMPHFLPGVASPVGMLAGSLELQLKNGVRLAPALPPPIAAGAVRQAHEMRLRNFRIGETVVSMRVALEPDGVQVDIDYVSGPALNVRIVLPEPAGTRIGVVYVDWEEQEELVGDHEVRLTSEDPEHSLWGRFERSRQRWPRLLPDAPTARLQAGLVIVIGRQLGAESGRVLRFGEALSELLEVPVDFRESDEAVPSAPTSPAEPLTLRFDTQRNVALKLPALVGLAETWALR